MLMSRLRVIALSAVAGGVLAACSGDSVTHTVTPPLAAVRYINALPDTFGVDIRMIDQVQWSATGNRVLYRGATEYFAVEAKARRIRVFPQPGPTTEDGAPTGVVSQILVDETITFAPNKAYTLLLTGRAREGTARFVIFEDDAAAPPEGDIGLKAVNLTASPLDFHAVATTTTAIGTAPTFTSVSPLAASSYVTRDSGAFAVRAAAPGSSTAMASAAAPNGELGTPLINPLPGARVAGTVLSVYAFPPSVTGSKAASFPDPGLVFYVDRLPPLTAVSP